MAGSVLGDIGILVLSVVNLSSTFTAYPLWLLFLAHMWFNDDIHKANTSEDPHHPERTRRVSIL